MIKTFEKRKKYFKNIVLKLFLSSFKLTSFSRFFSRFEPNSKDVRLPVQLQRAMAAEAEATREARAKVSCPLIDFHWLIRFL